MKALSNLTIILLIVWSTGQSVGIAQDYPAPRTPQIPTPADVDELLTGAVKVLDEFGIRADASVLLFTDRTVEPLVNEALGAALENIGARYTLVQAEGYPEVTTPLQQIQFWGLNWLPDWMWGLAADRFQFIVSPSYFVHLHSSVGKHRFMPWAKENGVRYLRVRESAGKLAYAPWAEYPRELELAIIEKVLEMLPQRRTRVHVTDPEGTDFTYDDNWAWYIQAWEKGQRSLNAGSVHVTGSPIQYLNAEGVFVSRDLHLGPLAEPIAIYFQDSKITRVEGGGEVGDYVRDELDRLKDKVFVTTEGFGVPGPRPLKGVGWLEETAFMTHPKWIRVPDYGEAGRQSSFSTAFNNWVGMGRSGVYHVAIGMSESTAWGPAQMPSTERDWHIDFLNYFATLTVGDTVLIKDGRLVVLDDPEIREIASRYGDPDELLREDWIPAIPGVNVP